MTLKYDRWPWKTIATSSSLHHFIAICEFKLEVQSGNTQIWAKFVLNSVTLTFGLWPSLLHGHHFCQWQYILRISWWYNERNIVKDEPQTDGRTDRSVLGVVWSQLQVNEVILVRMMSWKFWNATAQSTRVVCWCCDITISFLHWESICPMSMHNRWGNHRYSGF